MCKILKKYTTDFFKKVNLKKEKGYFYIFRIYLSQRWHNYSIFSGISCRSYVQKQVLSDMLGANRQRGEELMPISGLVMLNLGLNNAQKYKDKRFLASLRQTC